ncbi:hypothetical protein AOLI_G00065630 [Acnodon oligacanthus]
MQKEPKLGQHNTDVVKCVDISQAAHRHMLAEPIIMKLMSCKYSRRQKCVVGTFCDDGLQLYTLQALLRFPAGKSGLSSPRQQPKVPNHLSYPSQRRKAF